MILLKVEESAIAPATPGPLTTTAMAAAARASRPPLS
jgi:hypothetical protein